nr:DUF1803 domain-containing protein [Enterococcus cecorum]
MEFFYGQKFQKIAPLIHSTFFMELVKYLNTYQDVTLRQLKADLTTEVHFDKRLDTLIAYGLIKRQSRRYTLHFPIYSEIIKDNAFNEVVDQATMIELARNLKPLENNSFYAMDIATFAHFDVLSNGYMRIETLYNDVTGQHLAGYLQACQQQMHLDKYTEMYNLLGDVDAQYLLDQYEVLFDKILHKRRRIRDSIFVQSAIDFGFVQREEQLVFTPDLLLDTHVNIAPELLEKFAQKSACEQRMLLTQILNNNDVNLIQNISLENMGN